ncbi:hypothetical protein EYF80_035073 [Liparis tanakae]|uniref:Uncharacterized protein n=1 Tax=Liparis tanakae TaxID=230148 RepID=A0A4Z2GNA6_9TELE|nr:hypothetical protein EYF80_035073 [Liparis tanakae]
MICQIHLDILVGVARRGLDQSHAEELQELTNLVHASNLRADNDRINPRSKPGNGANAAPARCHLSQLRCLLKNLHLPLTTSAGVEGVPLTLDHDHHCILLSANDLANIIGVSGALTPLTKPEKKHGDQFASLHHIVRLLKRMSSGATPGQIRKLSHSITMRVIEVEEFLRSPPDGFIVESLPSASGPAHHITARKGKERFKHTQIINVITTSLH